MPSAGLLRKKYLSMVFYGQNIFHRSTVDNIFATGPLWTVYLLQAFYGQNTSNRTSMEKNIFLRPSMDRIPFKEFQWTVYVSQVLFRKNEFHRSYVDTLHKPSMNKISSADRLETKFLPQVCQKVHEKNPLKSPNFLFWMLLEKNP